MKKNQKKSKKFFFFCENEKLDYPRFLGDFYYHGKMNVPCISEPKSIRNWVTFCGQAQIKIGKVKIKYQKLRKIWDPENINHLLPTYNTKQKMHNLGLLCV